MSSGSELVRGCEKEKDQSGKRFKTESEVVIVGFSKALAVGVASGGRVMAGNGL